MKTVIITGPSGSGKSYLGNKLAKSFDNSVLIKTDSYYRDNYIIKFLSIFLYDIYDRLISIKKNELQNAIKNINNKERIVSFYKYEFKSKKSTHSKISIDYKGDNQFIILEGIFAHRLDLNYQETINIVCEEAEEICFKRRLLRDQRKRGRKLNEVNKKFNRSWFLFYRNIQKFIENNKIISLNQIDNNSYDELVFKLKKITNKNNQKK